MGDADISPAAKAALYNSYKSQYGIDESDASVTSLLKSYGINIHEDKETGELNAQIWTSSDVDNLSKMYYSHNVTDEAFEDYFARYADGLGLNKTEAVNLYNAVVYSGAKRGTVNPSELEYKVVEEKDEYDYTGDVANKVKVVDEYGVERTIENVYYNIKVFYAMKKYPGEWESHVNDKEIKKLAKADIKEVQKKIGITKG